MSPAMGGHVVIGRHTSCDLVLREETVSLRHVLVRAWLLDDGLPVLSVLDLDSGIGFELSDGSRQRAVVATGPVVFRISTTSIVAIPSGEPLSDELAPPLVRWADLGGYAVDPRAGPAASAASRARSGRITAVPWSGSLSRSPAGRAAASVGGGFEMLLEADRLRASVRLSERDVDHGILVGRDPRCVDAGLRAVLDAGVSRVHALVIRERDGVRLYDIASTNGMTDGVRPVRSMTLDDAGTRAQLGGSRVTTITWRALR